MTARRLLTSSNLLGAALVAVLLLLPNLTTAFFVNFVMTQTFILGLAAATIVFLAKYGGMTSLAQFLLFGVAGFMFGNAAQETGSRGLNLGWSPWVAIGFALLVTVAVAFVLGAIASRSTGIYFLMLTFVYAVIGYFVFAQIVEISGPGGITSIQRPDFLGPPVRLYYAGLLLSVLAYLGFRAAGRTPFGLALQGVRDDPVRMASLGFNVRLYRTLAFSLAGFVAGLSGLLNVWWNGQIDPASIATGPTLILLIIAVIGGITSFEGAWLGAFVYVWVFTYLRDLPLIDEIGITEARFNTVIGVIVLLIMVLSPEGLTGIVQRLRRHVGARITALQGPALGGSPSTGKRAKESGGMAT
ncbi:branched-chain amino acid ABC transporter permease [Streptomyces profundus]|uniref:branched-chain amino acid ABC transporter permease n=1 Tax=Streptomyces profundus TaxID=2867410 RepID=UPI001D169913|nr:branched-chain amino acid ABC transporter permease [Streptomyces sp. MA3_2.13]UED87597.1 branched-chain amino acid ABC transporter permease [Streptomyces sp. MA3_2.13]